MCVMHMDQKACPLATPFAQTLHTHVAKPYRMSISAACTSPIGMFMTGIEG